MARSTCAFLRKEQMENVSMRDLQAEMVDWHLSSILKEINASRKNISNNVFLNVRLSLARRSTNKSVDLEAQWFRKS